MGVLNGVEVEELVVGEGVVALADDEMVPNPNTNVAALADDEMEVVMINRRRKSSTTSRSSTIDATGAESSTIDTTGAESSTIDTSGAESSTIDITAHPLHSALSPPKLESLIQLTELEEGLEQGMSRKGDSISGLEQGMSGKGDPISGISKSGTPAVGKEAKRGFRGGFFLPSKMPDPESVQVQVQDPELNQDQVQDLVQDPDPYAVLDEDVEFATSEVAAATAESERFNHALAATPTPTPSLSQILNSNP